VTARAALGESSTWGKFSGTAVASYLRGRETSSGDNLFNMMPLNLKTALIQRVGRWTQTAELLLVARKTHVSSVRNEVPTAGYGLLNLRTSAQWNKKLRLDVGIENALNHDHQQPLGGAYLGQGTAMFLDSLHWGDAVPGMGRSINLSLSATF
jgi:iron complex outermembrane recepter protein